MTATAQLLQTGGIESADVPLTLQRLSAGLSTSPDRETFLAMDTEEALKWLMESQTNDGQRCAALVGEFFSLLLFTFRRCLYLPECLSVSSNSNSNKSKPPSASASFYGNTATVQ